MLILETDLFNWTYTQRNVNGKRTNGVSSNVYLTLKLLRRRGCTSLTRDDTEVASSIDGPCLKPQSMRRGRSFRSKV